MDGFIALFGKAPVTDITVEDLASALESDTPPQLIDVRTRAEFRSGHIEGAIHWPLLKLLFGPKPELDPHRPVVTICRAAHRSIPATRFLLRRGFSASQLEAGMLNWMEKNRPVITG